MTKSVRLLECKSEYIKNYRILDLEEASQILHIVIIMMYYAFYFASRTVLPHLIFTTTYGVDSILRIPILRKQISNLSKANANKWWS